MLNDDRQIFNRNFEYSELISGSQNFSSGYVIITKVGKLVFANVNLYFNNALSVADHQLLSKSQLQDINCWVPEPSNGQSFGYQKIGITGVAKELYILTINGNDAAGLCIYPLTTAMTVGDHFRDQLMWVSE